MDPTLDKLKEIGIKCVQITFIVETMEQSQAAYKIFQETGYTSFLTNYKKEDGYEVNKVRKRLE
jgi:hypothetical protein